MRQVEDRVQLPMEVVCDEGYLLEQAIEGVAYDSPAEVSSTWNM